MDKKKLKQRFFIARELRLSIALIVIWSLLVGILFAYLTKELGAKIEHGIFSFIAVFLGYVLIVIFLAIVFTHRLIGPFERLKMEIKLILAGNYHRRLRLRNSDDFYIKSFISDVNKLLDNFEERCIEKEGFRKNIDAELLHLVALIEKEEVPRKKLKEAILSFHEKIESLLENKKE